MDVLKIQPIQTFTDFLGYARMFKDTDHREKATRRAIYAVMQDAIDNGVAHLGKNGRWQPGPKN